MPDGGGAGVVDDVVVVVDGAVGTSVGVLAVVDRKAFALTADR